ncbi:GGDEF domain-containing protein [Alteromonas sp. 5E99-2]|uniref:diguanylate cyclase n=1 Tax=Alteromonas sp. 5E99-2 TaxID=2817683 RepID=UPI001A98A9DB|nr:GGDEF domain-containing protein [Alteromonas sp. 5E99-2]
MDALKQKALKKYSDNLAQLITRLSAFYEGTNTTIDAELKILRGHLSGKPDFSLAAVSINKLSPLLMDGDQHVRHQIKNKVADLQATVKKIQQLDQTPEELRRSIAQQLTSLSAPTTSLEQMFSHLFSAVSLVETCVKSSHLPEGNNESNSSGVDGAVDEVKTEIVSELLQWVDVYARKKPNDTELIELKTVLAEGLSEQQLLESCLVLIRVIINETMLDASANGKAIQRIHAAINKTDKHVASSISLSQKITERDNAQVEQIEGILGEFDSSLKQQKDVEELKTKAHEYIDQIRSEVHDKHKINSSEQEKLMSLLVDMQAQLTSLQKQTLSYKKRLVEQKNSLYTDPLTGVPNRLAYNERAVKAMSFAETQNDPLALSVIDIDHFKSINDQYGHAAGDRTLQVIAKNLMKNLRPNEFLARWGGEEFALLMQNQSDKNLKSRLDEMREELSQLPFKFKQTPVKITASFGASCYKNGETLQQFFERADKALYSAKKTGRNRVIIEL